MAQGGFKRTGNAFSAKMAKAASHSSTNSNKIRKGARVIAPKKSVAMARINLTQKLTSQLNRRAESALITRLGGNRENSLKLVRADSQIVEELKSKKAKKEGNAADNPTRADTRNEKPSNALTNSALKHLNGLEGNDLPADTDSEQEQECEE